jgi:hypothetical protein
MAKPLFIWIGAGRARRRGVGPSGRALDTLASAGLPVPPGAILLDEFYRFALANDVAEVSGEAVFISDAEVLLNTLTYSMRLPSLKPPAVLRPLFSSSREADHPSVNDPSLRLAVDPAEAMPLARALGRVWSAAIPGGDALRRDVALSHQVAARFAGTARSPGDGSGDAVSFDSATAGETVALPRLGRWSGPDPALPPHLQRLQRLLRGMRRTLGPGNWAVEWADDGSICWLTGVAPY